MYWLHHLGSLLSHNESTKANSPITGSAMKGTKVDNSVPDKKQETAGGKQGFGAAQRKNCRDHAGLACSWVFCNCTTVMVQLPVA